MRFLFPTLAERPHLRNFYLASFFAEATHLAMPFKVLLVARYLGLPQLGVVLLVEQLISLVMEVPAGAWADRFGRKPCVLLGHLVAAAGWLMIPLATLVDSQWRLVAMGLSYGMCGAGSALISGAHESWVVDNLKFVKRQELIATFFGRDRSLASVGGVVATVIALGLVGWMDLRWFWVITGVGELLTMVVLWRAPECTAAILRHPADEPNGEALGRRRQNWWQGLKVIFERPELLAFTLMLAWLSLAFGASAEVFNAVLTESHLHEQGFAALALCVRCLGAVTPLLAVGLAGRFGSRSLMSGAIVLSGCVALMAWQKSGLGPLIVAYLVATGCISLFYTAADHYQHGLLPSATRATASSTINVLVSVAMLFSTGLLTLLLGWLPASTVVVVMGMTSLPAALFLCTWRRPVVGIS